MSCLVTGETHCKCKHNPCITYPVDMKETLRKLFTDHAVYTKFVINSVLDSNPDATDLLNRLMQNQNDIGDYVKPIIGGHNGNLLAELLRGHIGKAGEALAAVKSRNPQAISVAVNNLLNQGDSVALFLSNLNPVRLPYSTVAAEFRKHNQFVADLAVLHYQKNTLEEIKTYDAYYNHMLMFSDLVYYGLSQ